MIYTRFDFNCASQLAMHGPSGFLPLSLTAVTDNGAIRSGSAAHTLHYRQSEDIAKVTGSRIALTERGPGAK